MYRAAERLVNRRALQASRERARLGAIVLDRSHGRRAASPAQGLLASWRIRVAGWRRELHALSLAARDPRTPWYARALAMATVAYALSPLDLIPDAIPVLGHLDDLLLVPLGLWLAVRLVPRDVLADCRARAAAAPRGPAPRGTRVAALAIVLAWATAAVVVLVMVRSWLRVW
jgi:uncharacterized membrane protein YkvA (DUF1232 family)